VDVSDLGILAGAWGIDVRPAAATAAATPVPSTDGDAVDLLAAGEPVEMAAAGPADSAGQEPQTPRGLRVRKQDRLDPVGLQSDGQARWWTRVGQDASEPAEPDGTLDLLTVPLATPVE
jgi:hypothetical protein